MRNDVLSDLLCPCLIHDTKQRDEVFILLLRYELGDDTNVRERALSIRETHDTLHEVNLAKFTRMIIA